MDTFSQPATGEGRQSNMAISIAWTNFYRMYHAYRGQLHLVSKQLHDKYGPVVRMGPNYLDVDYPSLIKVCFDTSGTWRKVGRQCRSRLSFPTMADRESARPDRVARRQRRPG